MLASILFFVTCLQAIIAAKDEVWLSFKINGVHNLEKNPLKTRAFYILRFVVLNRFGSML
jgi:hypothetical protein